MATDYVSLGTPGLHPHLDGPTETYSVIDMARAARAGEPALLAAVRGMLTVPTSGNGQPVSLRQGLTDAVVPAPLALTLPETTTSMREILRG